MYENGNIIVTILGSTFGGHILFVEMTDHKDPVFGHFRDHSEIGILSVKKLISILLVFY